MITPEKQLVIRKTLIASGLRTVAFNFDGAGDSGSVEDLLVTQTFPTPSLDELLSSDVLDSVFESAHVWGKLKNGEYGSAVKPFAKPVIELLESIPEADDVLRDMAYSALEHFDGDWVNNDGGFGIVAFDLITGAFRIEGFQRYTDTHDADSDGTFLEAIDETTLPPPEPIDLTALLKSTLNA